MSTAKSNRATFLSAATGHASYPRWPMQEHNLQAIWKSLHANLPCLTAVGLIAPTTIAVLLFIVVSACLFGGFDYDASRMNIAFFTLAKVYLVATAIRRVIRRMRVGESLQAFCLFTAMSILTLFADAAMGKGQVAYIDDTLEAVDRALFWGFDWPAANAALSAHPQVITLLSYAYSSLGWQPLLLFAVMGWKRSNTDITGFMASWSLALLACALPFHWLPARGAYVHYGIPPSAVPGLLVRLPWEYPVTLEGVRSGMLHTFGQQMFFGLVTAPSFHACAAVLFGWAFHKVPVLRWPLGLLNGLMLVSAVPCGGHYLIDVAAGVAIAIGAIWLSGRIDGWFGGSVRSRTAASPSDNAAIAPPRAQPA